MKWKKGARKGIIVAGGKGEGDSLTQLHDPSGIIVDHFGNIYVTDCLNHRIMCWSKGSKKGHLVVSGNEVGNRLNQFKCTAGVSFDRNGNLYVVDWYNHRVQKFNIDFN